MKLMISCFGRTAVTAFLVSGWVLAAQERPVFRAGVEAVAVDVVVVDRDGHPVRDLTVEDFTLLVDGRPRSLVSLEYVEMTSEGTTAPPTEKPRHFSTNVGAVPGRLVLFVVDRESIPVGEGKPVMEAAQRFLDRLSPNDRAGIFTIPRGGPRIDFTSDKARIREALDQIVGLGGEPFRMYNIGLAEALAISRGDRFVTAEVVERECSLDPDTSCRDLVVEEALSMARDLHWKARESLTSLHNLTKALKEIDSPKVLVLISQGLVQEIDTLVDMVPLARTAAAARPIY